MSEGEVVGEAFQVWEDGTLSVVRRPGAPRIHSVRVCSSRFVGPRGARAPEPSIPHACMFC